MINTPRPAFPWKIEVLPPHAADQNTRYNFPTKDAALAEVRVRKWKIAKSKNRWSTVKTSSEFIVVAVLLFPLVYELAKTSPIEHLINTYTGWVLSAMVASFMHPIFKLIILLIRGADSTAELVTRIIVYIVIANGFFFAFGSAFAPTVPNASAILAEIEKHRAEMTAKHIIFPGMTLEEFYATPYRRADGMENYPHHTNDIEWSDQQRKYRQLRARADEEGNKPNDGVHPYRKILQYAYDLWVKRHSEAAEAQK